MHILIIILILILLIIIALIIKSYNDKNKNIISYYNNTDNESQHIIEDDNKEPQCVCSFDIDHTITCGNPKPFIDKCIEKGCKLALNTARPVKYIGDVDLESINFIEPYYNTDDFYYNPNSYSQHPNIVGQVKSSYLELLRNKYTISNKKCIVLLDDSPINIKIAQENGYSTIKANYLDKNNPMCGLSHNNLDKLDNILSMCTN